MPVLIAPLVAAAGLTGTAASVATFAGSVAAGVGFALISQLLVPAEKPAGGKREKVATGSTVPRCMLFGRVATAGAIVYDNVYGADDRQLQIVTAIADHRCKGIVAAVIDGKTKSVSNYNGGGYDQEIDDYNHRFQFNFVEGTENQTASAVLTNRANPSARWSSEHRLRSICHVISHLEYREKEFPGMAPPQVMWVVEGGYWYDPRKDSTQSGGSGAHRWNDKSTWEYSENPYVALYNYLRGLWVNGELWVGAGLDDVDLDLDAFMAAMDVCDDEIENPDGSFSPRYRISLIAEGGRNANHRKVLDAVRLATAGEVAIRRGKIWVAAGVPRSPVVQITDADIMPNTAIRYTPKRPAGGGLLNEAYGTFLAETAEWSQKDLTPYIDESARTADGQRLDVGIDYTMVRNKWQALRLLKYTVQQSRYQASAKITVRPYLIGVEAGDIIEWTSARFGFTKAFLVKEWEDQDAEMLQATWSLQEIDALGYTGPGDDGGEDPPDPPGGGGNPFAPENFSAAHHYIGSSGNRKAAALCTWEPPEDESIIGMVIQIRLQGATVSSEDAVDQYTIGEFVTTSGIGPAGNYEVRASYKRDSNPLERIWTDWILFYSNGDTGDTTPPAKPATPTLSQSSETQPDLTTKMSGAADWTPNSESDLDGYYVHLTRGTDTQVVMRKTPHFEWDGLVNAIYTVQIAAFDKSGNVSVLSDPSTITLTGDTVPPAVPTDLVVTRVVKQAADGTTYTLATATWSAPVDVDFDSHKISIVEAGEPEQVYLSRPNSYSWRLIPGATYVVKVLALDVSGNHSAYSDPFSFTAEIDNTPPAVPANVVVISGFKELFVDWDPVADADLRHYEVYVASAATPVPVLETVPTHITTGTSQPLGGLVYGDQRWVWVRAVDQFLNKSAWSTVATGTVGAQVGAYEIVDGAVIAGKIGAGAVAAANLVDGAVEAAKIATGAILASKLAANAVTTAAVAANAITAAQIAAGAVTATKFASGLTPIEIVATLPATGNFAGRTVILTTDNKLYRHTGSAWTAAVPATDIAGQVQAAQIAALEASKITGQIVAAQIADGAVSTAKFASGLTPVEIVGTLPTTGNFAGRTVVLTTDNKLYRYTGSAWTASVPAADISGQVAAAQIAALEASKITGQLSDAQIAAIAAAKLTGQITQTQITDSSISTSKLAANAVTAAKIAANTITASQIAAGTITATEIATGTITGNKIAANTITAAQIAAGTITASEINATSVRGAVLVANSITSAMIQAGAVTANEVAANAITAKHLVLTDLTNRILNGDFTQGTEKWSIGSTSVVEVSGATDPGGMRRLKSGNAYPATQWIDVVSGEILRLSCMLYDENLTADSGIYVKFYGGDATTFISGGWCVKPTVRNSWTSLVGQVTVPAGAQKALIYLHVSKLEGTDLTTYTYWGKVRCQRAADASLIVDGAVTATKVAAGAITTAKLAAGAVTANEIAAGAVVAGKIAAGAVTATEINAASVRAAVLTADSINAGMIQAGAVGASEIAAGAVTAGKIAAGAVTAGTIAAGVVTAAEIGAGAITTAKLAAGAVTANEIGAGAITAVKIQAGAVAADAIAANAISAKHLVLTDLTNRVLNGDFTQGSEKWTLFGNTIRETDAPNSPTGLYRIRSGEREAAIQDIDVVAGEVLRLSCVVYNANAGTDAGVYVNFFDSNFNAISGGWAAIDNNIGSWRYPQGQITVPAGAHKARLYLLVTKTIGTNPTTYCYWGKVRCQRAADASLIVDGAVTADKVAANAITAVKIAAGQITAAKLAITDTTNLVPDPDFLTLGQYPGTTGWVCDQGLTIVFTANWPWDAMPAYSNVIGYGVAQSGYIVFRSPIFPVLPGRDYWASIMIGGNAPTNAPYVFQVDFYTNADASTYVASTTIASNTFQYRGILSGNFVAPAGAKFARLVPHKQSGGANMLYVGSPIVKLRANGELIVDGAITTAKLFAGAVTADKIAANAVTADKILAGSITTVKLAAGAVTANELAANSVTAAKIVAGTITADKLVLSSREVLFQNLRFEPVASSNTVYWSSCTATWKDAANNLAAVGIAAGSTTWGGGTRYIYWQEGSTVFNVTLDANVAHQPGNKVVAAYIGGSNLVLNFGATIIDGSFIRTNAITATHIAANTITATEINAASIQTAVLTANSISSAMIQAGAITTAKLDALAVTAAKISANAIVAGKIAANAITGDELSVDSITTNKITIGGVTTDRLAVDAVTNMSTYYDASLIGSPGSLAVTERLLGSINFTRTANTKMVAVIYWEAEASSDTIHEDTLQPLTIYRNNPGSPTVTRQLRVPHLKIVGGNRVAGGSMSFAWIDEANVSGSVNYKFYFTWCAVSKRTIILQEFKR